MTAGRQTLSYTAAIVVIMGSRRVVILVMNANTYPAPGSAIIRDAHFAGARVFGCLVDSDGDRVFDNATYEHRTTYFPITNPVPYEIARTVTDYPNEDAFKFDILYQGVSRGEIKISYREYINNMARASFNQDVTYELNRDGPTDISFKGARMKIIRADNHEVEYVVEQAAGTALRDEVEPVPKASDEKPWYQREGGKQ